MSENAEVRCSQCATLYPAGEPRCPHCGLSQTPPNHIQQIEQLLESSARPAPERPAASVLPQAFKQTLRMSAASPAEEADIRLQWGTASGQNTAEEAAAPRSRTKRRVILLVTGLVLFVAAVTAVSLWLSQTTMGYRSSPENLMRGIQNAFDAKDERLFIELISRPDTDADALLAQGFDPFSKAVGFQLETEDVILGKNQKSAIVFAKVSFSSVVAGEDFFSSHYEPLVCYKKDGLWYTEYEVFYPSLYSSYS